jgi:ABC-2 type transport system ATP-binding protein
VIGEAAAAAGIVLHELAPRAGTLEDSYLSLTADAVEYHSSPVPSPTAPAALSKEQLR